MDYVAAGGRVVHTAKLCGVLGRSERKTSTSSRRFLVSASIAVAILIATTATAQTPAPAKWAEVPDSHMGPEIMVMTNAEAGGTDVNAPFGWSESGGAYDSINDQACFWASGGHADYGGTELYCYAFATNTWTRPLDPMPLDGPPVLDDDGDGVPDLCPAPRGFPDWPLSSHNYDGLEFVEDWTKPAPNRKKLYRFGAGHFCAGPVTNFVAGDILDMDTLIPSPYPRDAEDPLNQYLDEGSWSRIKLAYDAARHKLIVIPIGGKVHEIDPETGKATRALGPPDAQGNRPFRNVGYGGSGMLAFSEATRTAWWMEYRKGPRRMSVSLSGVYGPEELPFGDWKGEGFPFEKMTALAIEPGPRGDVMTQNNAEWTGWIDVSEGRFYVIYPGAVPDPNSQTRNKAYRLFGREADGLMWNMADAHETNNAVGDALGKWAVFNPPTDAQLAAMPTCQDETTPGGPPYLDMTGTWGAVVDGCWWDFDAEPVLVTHLLELDMTDTAHHGWKWDNDGPDPHQSRADFVFDEPAAGVLEVQGYDIDHPNGSGSTPEVTVELNGVEIGHLSQGPNNGLGALDTFVLDPMLLVAGENTVSFIQRNPGWKWGVTNLTVRE